MEKKFLELILSFSFIKPSQIRSICNEKISIGKCKPRNRKMQKKNKIAKQFQGAVPPCLTVWATSTSPKPLWSTLRVCTSCFSYLLSLYPSQCDEFQQPMNCTNDLTFVLKPPSLKGLSLLSSLTTLNLSNCRLSSLSPLDSYLPSLTRLTRY